MVGIQQNVGVVCLDGDSVLDTYLIMSCLSLSALIEVPKRRWQWWDLNSECCDKQLTQRLGDLGLISIRVITLLFVLMVEEGYCRCERKHSQGQRYLGDSIRYCLRSGDCSLSFEKLKEDQVNSIECSARLIISIV